MNTHNTSRKQTEALAAKLGVVEDTNALIADIQSGSPVPRNPSENPVERNIGRDAMSAITALRSTFQAEAQRLLEAIVATQMDDLTAKQIYAGWKNRSKEFGRYFSYAIDSVHAEIAEATALISKFVAVHRLQRQPILSDIKGAVRGSASVTAIETAANGLFLILTQVPGGILGGTSIAFAVAAINGFAGAFLAKYARPMTEPLNHKGFAIRWLGRGLWVSVILLVLAANVGLAMYRTGGGASTITTVSDPSNIGLIVIGVLIAVMMYIRWSSRIEPVHELDELSRRLKFLKLHADVLWKTANGEMRKLADAAKSQLQVTLRDQETRLSAARKAGLEIRNAAEDFENQKFLVRQDYANVVDLHRMRLRPLVKESGSYLDQPVEMGKFDPKLATYVEESAQDLNNLKNDLEQLKSTIDQLMDDIASDADEAQARFKVTYGLDMA